ncbi:MAG TPA: precorrin-4 C(11)-methyltransferase [Polyangiales bacterium]|nr:precorrin-4 C(11)-methyltransferase [Polyangiales bacterium]
MTVHFIGAGPGAPDLITVRGRDLVARCPVCLYAGSLVPREIVALAPPGARVLDSAPLNLDEIEAELVAAHERGLDVARLHSGDLSLWSAMGEQLRRLKQRNIPFTVTPGVPAFAASAAAIAQELTLPEVTQSVVLTRTSGRASQMPSTETLEHFAASRATLAVHLSVHVIDSVVERLTPFYGAECAVAVVYRASWPDQKVLRGTLATIAELVKSNDVGATATILVGPVLSAEDFRESALYSTDYQRRFRGRD